MRSSRSIVRILAMAALIGCQGYGPTYPGGISGGGGGGGSGTNINVNDNFFDPSGLTVSVNDPVTWTWVGDSTHNVTFVDGTTSPTQANGGTYTRTFTTAGTYPYICTIHSGMSGTVTAQ
jgi:plastocyanin